MARAALVALLAVLWLPAPAPAATVDVDVTRDEGLLFGTVTFRAAPGERNRLAVSSGSRGLVFFDAANPVRARGDCTQLGRHRARCPSTEDLAVVRLGDLDDVARVGTQLGSVHGGSGDDVLRGSPALDALDGGRGDDRLRGGIGDDELTGGPGRDHILGERGDDTLIDGETDAQAADDVLDGGTSSAGSFSPRDTVDYGKRRRAIRIDLRRRTTSTEDRLRGFESVTTGHGDDRLSGDGGSNWLTGGPGEDVLHGRDGPDIPMGGAGDDRVHGDSGRDVVWGDEGRDRLFGGGGHDFVISLEERGGPAADRLDCGAARDDARSDSRDTLASGCESVTAFSNGLHVDAQPAIDADSADFRVGCPDSCQGTIMLRGLDGRPFGTVHFSVPSEAVVSVPLTPEGAAALDAGTTVVVELRPDDPRIEDPGGYRVFMRAP